MVETSTSVVKSLLSLIRLNSQGKLIKPEPGERIISLDEVSWHDKQKDCWMVIYDRIYDLTKFLDEHPGGSDILLEYAGRDASVAFRGSGHSLNSIYQLKRFLIGELPIEERMYRKPGGFQLSDIPD